jgi:hypothetical protein
MKQAAATHRVEIQEAGKRRSDDVWANEEREQVQTVERTQLHKMQTDMLKAQNVEELKGHIALMLQKMQDITDMRLAHMDYQQAMKQAERAKESAHAEATE